MIKKVLIFGVLTYKKLISPFFRRSCRFYPSCSSYSVEAIEKHGPFKGLIMAMNRVLRCNQYSKGGVDPVK